MSETICSCGLGGRLSPDEAWHVASDGRIFQHVKGRLPDSRRDMLSEIDDLRRDQPEGWRDRAFALRYMLGGLTVTRDDGSLITYVPRQDSSGDWEVWDAMQEGGVAG